MNAITAVEKDGVTLNRYKDIFTEYCLPTCARASAGHGRALSSCAGGVAVGFGWILRSGRRLSVPPCGEGRQGALTGSSFPSSAQCF
jgi:hypothetical protein